MSRTPADAVVPQCNSRQRRSFATVQPISRKLIMKNNDRFKPACTIGNNSIGKIMVGYRDECLGDPEHAFALRICGSSASTDDLFTLLNQKTAAMNAARFMERLPPFPTILKMETYNRDGVIVMELGTCSLEFFLKKEGRHLGQLELCDLANDLVPAVLFLIKHNCSNGSLHIKHVVIKNEENRVVFKLSPHGFKKNTPQQNELAASTTNGRHPPPNEDLAACADILLFAASYLAPPLEDTTALLEHSNYDPSFHYLLVHLVACLKGPILGSFENKESEIRVLLQALRENHCFVVTLPRMIIMRHIEVSDSVLRACTLSGNPPLFHEVADVENCHFIGPSGCYQMHSLLDLAELKDRHFIAYRSGLRLRDIPMSEFQRPPSLNSLNEPRIEIILFLNKGRQALRDGQTLIVATRICHGYLASIMESTLHENANLLDQLELTKRSLEKKMSAHFEIRHEEIFAWESKKIDISQINKDVEACFDWREAVKKALLSSDSLLDVMLAQP